MLLFGNGDLLTEKEERLTTTCAPNILNRFYKNVNAQKVCLLFYFFQFIDFDIDIGEYIYIEDII